MIVYQYGLHSPHENAHVVFEQMRLAHRYRNTLCAIERARRAAMRAMLRDLSALLLEYETAAAKWHAEVEVVLGRIKASRKASRKRSESEADKALLREARAMHKSAVGLLREARRQAREAPHVVAETERINALAADLKRNARAHSGLYWGTYLRIEDAAAQSAKMPLYDGEHPNDPRFIRWRPDCWHGECAVQLQNGLPLDRLVSGADTRLRLTLPEVGAWDHPSWAERHRRARTAALQMRVASTKSGAPVWATFTLDMHRPLPKDSVVKWAVVQRVPVGPHFRWVLLLTVDAPTTGILPETGSIVALDVGWRALEGGLRVACWRGSDGASGEVRLSPKDLARLREPDDLRSARDMLMDTLKTHLGAWLKVNDHAPAWLKEETAALHAWRAPDRFGKLRWMLEQKERFKTDDYPRALLDGYLAHDRHLWAQESRRRARSLRMRREIYRVVAAALATRYGVLVLEKFDLRDVARKPDALDPSDNASARGGRHLASVSELRSALSNAARSRGRMVVTVDPAHSSHVCPACGCAITFDAKESLTFACDGCGITWDQDLAAAANLLARYLAAPAAANVVLQGPRAQTEVMATEKEGRWAKARRMGKAKKERQADAP